MKKEEILNLLRREKSRLFHKYPLRRLALFGSYARDEQAEINDIDILAEIDPSIGLKFVSLAEELEEILQCRVDLVSSRAITPAMMQHIERELIDA